MGQVTAMAQTTASDRGAVRFGVVGTGHMADAMMPAFAESESAQVVAVASRSDDRARAFAERHGLDRAHGHLDGLLEDDAVDAIYVANATEAHAATSIAALEAGKAVMCEKPFAVDVAEATAVHAVAARTGVLFMEAMWTPHLPSWRRALELATDGTIGDAHHLTAGFGYPDSPASLPRVFTNPGGGVLLDRGVYPVALAVLLFGDAVQVQASIRYDEAGIDLESSLQLTHADGQRSQLVASLDTLQSNRAAISGTRGHIELGRPLLGCEHLSVETTEAPSQPAGPSGGGARDQVVARLKASPLARRARRAIPAGGERHPYGADQYTPQLDHFCELVRRGARESDVVTHAVSQQVMSIIDRARAASPAPTGSDGG